MRQKMTYSAPAIERARQAYEAGARTADIAEALGVSLMTFTKRRKEWGWPLRAGGKASVRVQLRAARKKTADKAAKAGKTRTANDAAPGAEPVTAPDSGGAPPEPDDASAAAVRGFDSGLLVRAVRSAVESEIADVETQLADARRLDTFARNGKRSGEGSARMLASLARTLTIMRGLEADAGKTGEPGAAVNDKGAVPDVAKLRDELARRLDRLHRKRNAS